MSNPQPTTDETLQLAIERFWEAFPPVWNTIRSHVRGIASEQFGISVEQYNILRLIRKGRRSVSELAEDRQISRPAISQAVELLVEKQLIARKRGSKDRRFVELELTPAGSEMINRIFAENRAWMKTRLAALSDDETRCIICGMELLEKAFLDPSA